MASQINPPSERQMEKVIGVSGRMFNYHINKTLKSKVRKKLQVHRLTKVNIEKRKKRSWGLHRSLNNETRRIQYVSRDVKHPTLEVYQRRENHSSAFMVWGGASFNGKTKLHIVDPGAKVNSTYYINNVLKPFLTKDALRLYSDGDFVFHHDSAPSHVSKMTTEFMKGKLKCISQEKWMSKSPDAAPMDYFVWGYIKQQLWRTKAKDVAALKRVWKDMPQELVGAGFMTEALFKNPQK
ncbi:hypothetical protein ILUMI_14695 [Ignelater luminosus]|uniref:Transposase n=1 Tax=Ignelater luminosus TaxID=2038154 RepID=A0A8K0GAP2_IGNLU|nr:hypothetical protein ILUMI_14695 [Ignelater luminosus]